MSLRRERQAIVDAARAGRDDMSADDSAKRFAELEWINDNKGKLSTPRHLRPKANSVEGERYDPAPADWRPTEPDRSNMVPVITINKPTEKGTD